MRIEIKYGWLDEKNYDQNWGQLWNDVSIFADLQLMINWYARWEINAYLKTGESKEFYDVKDGYWLFYFLNKHYFIFNLNLHVKFVSKIN